MRIWLDNQLPPALAPWLRATFGVDCTPVRDLGLAQAGDANIFQAARAAVACVMTKDDDFSTLVRRHGPPPQIVLVTCGNTSNARLRALLETEWPVVQTMLEGGEPLVELGDRRA